MTVTDVLTLTDTDALSELNTDIARDLISHAPPHLTETARVGPYSEGVWLSLYVTENDGAFVLYESETWTEAYQGDVTDVVPVFERAVRLTANQDVNISHDSAVTAETDFSDREFTDD